MCLHYMGQILLPSKHPMSFRHIYKWLNRLTRTITTTCENYTQVSLALGVSTLI